MVGSSDIRRVVSILMESPFYLEIPVKERLRLVKELAHRYQVE